MLLSSYVKRLDAEYKAARKEYTESYAEIADVNAKLNELNKHKLEYSTKGYEMRLVELRDRKEAAKAKLESAGEYFKKAAAAIRSECADTFSHKYGMNPAMIDEKAMMLLNSGVLTAAEYSGLAENYRNNNTMLKMISASMLNSNDDNIKNMGTLLLNKVNNNHPHTDVLDSLTYIGSMGLRGAYCEDTGSDKALGHFYTAEEAYSMSEGVASQLYDDKLSESLAIGETISTDTSGSLA